MGLGRALSVALLGMAGHVVEVEAHVAPGLPAFTMVGLPDTSVHEARDRVRAAVLNSGEPWPAQRITVGLSPAALPKGGSGFDLAVAMAVLAAAGALPARARTPETVFIGELGLDGRLRGVPGVLPAGLAAARAGCRRIAVSGDNGGEARLVPDAEVLTAATLSELLGLLRGHCVARGTRPDAAAPPLGTGAPRPDTPASDASPQGAPDLADVVGQLEARRGLEVAAAGGHHLFLCGPPGVGKTMLAERLPGLLPPLDDAAALEVSAIASLAGRLPADAPLVRTPPFCAPHHTCSAAALIGGGPGIARPGAISLAHRGVLLLDEAPEFNRACLDALRQPLESGEVTIARRGGTARYPARFTLVLAANPCPCGVDGSARAGACGCTPQARRRYLGKLSGPLLDRVDLRMWLRPASRAEMLAGAAGEPTARVRERVLAARERCARRLAGTRWRTNAEVPGAELRRHWPVPPAALRPVHRAFEQGRLTARGVDRVLRICWTLADLAGARWPTDVHVDEALAYRLAT